MRISDWSSDVCSSDLGGSVPPSRPALTAQAFRDVEADGVDEAGLDLRRDRLPEIGKLAGKLALDLGPGPLAPEGPRAAGAGCDDVAARRREGARRRLCLRARKPHGHYPGAPRHAGKTGRASCRTTGSQAVELSVTAMLHKQDIHNTQT